MGLYEKMKKVLVCILAWLFVLGFFSGVVVAYGISFDDAKEIQFDENGTAIIRGILGKGDTHYYSYSAYKGDKLNLTVLSSRTSSDKIAYIEVNVFDEEFDEISLFQGLLGGTMVDDKQRRSYISDRSEVRYLVLKHYMMGGASYEVRINKTCKEGYSDEFRRCEDGEWIENKVKVSSTEENLSAYIPVSRCEGCVFGEVCYAPRSRFRDKNGTAFYCSVLRTIIPQKEEAVSCDENYECLTNQCQNGVCVDTIGFIQRIVNWIKSILGLNE